MRHHRSPIVILLADDDEEDRNMTAEALTASRLANTVRFVEDGEELTDYLFLHGRYTDRVEAPLPGLILLDLNMPRKDGREALAEIKADPRTHQIPVVVLTTSNAEEDIVRSYDLGVSSFISKPVTFDALLEAMRVFTEYWLEIVALPEPAPSHA